MFVFESMSEITTIKVNGLEIKKSIINNNDYLCISDFVKNEDHPEDIIRSWIRNKTTIEFLGKWEEINNLNFKLDEFVQFRNEAGSNKFNIRPQKWIKSTNAIGITSKSGRYNSGTYAHIDIALEFASWLSPEFKLYLITEFRRLKKDEAERNNEIENWNNYRWLTKMNYKLQTDAIKNNIAPNIEYDDNKKFAYTTEADMINKIVFGMRARDFKHQCPEIFNENKNKNLRDFASKTGLQLIANLESANAQLINKNIISAKIRIAELQQQCENEKKSLQVKHKYHLYKISEGVYNNYLLDYKFFQDIEVEYRNYIEQQQIVNKKSNNNIQITEELKENNNFEATLEKIITTLFKK